MMNIYTRAQHSAVHVYDRNKPGGGFMFAIPVNDIPYRLNNGEWDGAQGVAFALVNAWEKAAHNPDGSHIVYRWLVAGAWVVEAKRQNGGSHVPLFSTPPDSKGICHSLHVPPKLARSVLENCIENTAVQVAGAKRKGLNSATSVYLRMLDRSQRTPRLSAFGLRQLTGLFTVLAMVMGGTYAAFTDITEDDDDLI